MSGLRKIRTCCFEMSPPIPTLPCVVCGRASNAFQFVMGNACSYEHLMAARDPLRGGIVGFVSDDGLFAKRPSGLHGGPPRTWTAVYTAAPMQNINAPFSQRGLYRRLKQETKGMVPHGKDV